MVMGIKSIQSNDAQTLIVTAKPYIAGAKVQLERYLEAQRVVKAYELGIGSGIDRCMYELSALLEHLDCIETALRSVDVKLPTGKTIREFRNHLRHDARGEIDKRTDMRTEKLGLTEGLQVHIEFADGGVKMGSTELTAKQINNYINTAEMTMWALLMGGNIEIDGEIVTIHQQQAEIANNKKDA